MEDSKNKQELGPVSLVEGTEADLPAFLALEQKLAGPTYRPETRHEDVLGGNKFFYMVKAGAKIVGQVAYWKEENNSIYINVVAIDPEFQGKGYGREATKQLLERFSKASKVWLVTHPDNMAAIGLYESLGFKITERKENYFGNGTPRVIMVKEQNKE